MLLPHCLIAAFVISVTALPQPADDDLFQDSIVDAGAGGSCKRGDCHVVECSHA